MTVERRLLASLAFGFNNIQKPMPTPKLTQITPILKNY